MCGRYTLLAEEVEILREFGLEHRINGYTPRYNIAPGQKVVAVIHDGNEKRAGFLKWGLVPGWAKDPKIGYKMINARSETAHEKPSFKRLMTSKRCLIIADSFYEWQRNGKEKQAKRISLKDRSLFAFAGLWDKWGSEDEELFTCTILTQDANSFMEPIHNRMPIILPKEMEDEWISPTKWKPDQALQFLQQMEMEDLDAYDVSDYVNSAKNEGPTCIEPIAN
ncbi:SOS response-associated peptidase [Thalassobacillus hwangdonensis]|uniref:Abasic site processing protein n=1 Tax=Thalassobacillus hwangdonensis TaxID=546108 RepID=A0ABW3L3Y8_9BACI